MKVADIMAKKNARVNVRVPVHMQEKLGESVTGRVVRCRRQGRTVFVVVKVARKGEHSFRPQDLTLVA